MIEAVFEDPAVKAQVFAEIEPHLAEGALLGSNTSTLPITDLAEGVSRPADFIGLHFFSPVDKMPLLEIIKGEQTSDETLYRALDFAKQIKKTPIVVNDSRGFFTSRVIGTFINEGIAMLAEGVPAPTIEQASSQAGYPAPVLQLSDELNLELMAQDPQGLQGGHRGRGRRVASTTRRSGSSTACSTRAARASSRGAGFYDYEDGKRTGLWAGLREPFPPVADPSAISLQGPRGAHALRRGARDGQVRGRGRDRVGRRRQHRLDLRDRLPGLDRRRAPVHQRLRGRRRPASSRARASWPSSTASASSRRPRWSRRPSAARRTPTLRRRSRPSRRTADRSTGRPGSPGRPARASEPVRSARRCPRTPTRCSSSPPPAPTELAAPGLSPRPQRKVAVLSCMDTRIDLFPMLGLERGDAHIIRNAGGLVTDDAMRSLSASQRLLGTEEIVVVMHEGCGLCGASEDDFRQQLADDGVLPDWRLGAFGDLESTLHHSLERLRTRPRAPPPRPHPRLHLRPRRRVAARGRRAGLRHPRCQLRRAPRVPPRGP